MRLTSFGLLVPAACLLAGGLTLAAGAGVHKQKADTIHGCARKQDGRLRIVAGAANCKRSERAIQWNVEGPQGTGRCPGTGGSSGTGRRAGRDRRSRAGRPAGAVGPIGPAGTRGTNRTDRSAGKRRACRPGRAAGRPVRRARPDRRDRRAQGPAGADHSLEGLNGVACHAGSQSGTVTLSYDASGHAVLTCGTGGGGGGGGESGPIKVNEFSTGVTSAATNEFVELYNAGTTAVDVGGYKVVYRSATGSSDTTLATLPTGTSLAPGAFYLLGGSGYAGSVPDDQSFGTSIASTGGSLGVKTATGTLTDAVAYGTAANGLGEARPPRPRRRRQPRLERDPPARRARHREQQRGLRRVGAPHAEGGERRTLTHEPVSRPAPARRRSPRA